MQKCRRFYGTKAIKPKNIDTIFAGGNIYPAVLPAYIIPTTSKHRREISSGEKRDVGKTVGAVSAECLSEVCCVFYSRLTDGMMCPACGEFLNNGCGTA